MPSPFSGMDPFIENQEWVDFHHSAIDVIREQLTPAAGPAYVVRVERRVYFEHVLEGEDDQLLIADVGIAAEREDQGAGAPPTSAAAIAPVECILPVAQEQRESYLVIKHRETLEVVTVIEVLSPGNKRPGSDGRRERGWTEGKPRQSRMPAEMVTSTVQDPTCVNRGFPPDITPTPSTPPEEKREPFLVIKDRETFEVVTVVEVLSPGNKRSGSDGRRLYLSKRETLLETRTHLVELDLLRGGERLPMQTPLPQGDYYAIVSRQERRPKADVYTWLLAHPLPSVPLPLLAGDADATLDLQAIFNTVYDRARYDLSIDYAAELKPPLGDAETEWLHQRVADWRSARAESTGQ